MSGIQVESDAYQVDTELTNAITNPGQYTYELFPWYLVWRQ